MLLDGEHSVCHAVLSLGWSGLHFKKINNTPPNPFGFPQPLGLVLTID
jgi:hypothetical protein